MHVLNDTGAKNPALVLYKFWLSVLKGCAGLNGTTPQSDPLGAMFFGSQKYCGIGQYDKDDRGRPVLAYGSVGWGQVYPLFQLRADGAFTIRSPHASWQRDWIASHTFLQWGYFRGYNWYVSTKPEHMASLGDWRDQRHYMSERVMVTQGWSDKPWMKLVESDDPAGWEIRYIGSGGAQRNGIPVTQEDFDKWEALRQKRYRLLERQWNRLMGLEPTPQPRPEPTEDERAQRHQAAVQAITAHLTVSMPARSVPLRKTPEEEGLWQLSGSH